MFWPAGEQEAGPDLEDHPQFTQIVSQIHKIFCQIHDIFPNTSNHGSRGWPFLEPGQPLTKILNCK